MILPGTYSSGKGSSSTTSTSSSAWLPAISPVSPESSSFASEDPPGIPAWTASESYKRLERRFVGGGQREAGKC